MNIVCVLTKTMDAKQEYQGVFNCSRMSQSALGALKQQDPFLYNSIPAVHKAALVFKDVDVFETTDASRPAIVARKSRLTTECHTDLHLEDILDNGEIFQESDDEDPALVDSSDALDLFILLGALPRDICKESA